MTRIIAILFSLLLVLTGCAQTPASDSATAEGPTGTNRPADPEPEPEPEAEPEAEPVTEPDADGGPAAFGQSFTWDDGLAVTIGAPTSFTPTPNAAGGEAFDSHLLFQVTIVNGSDVTYEDFFTTTMQSGNTEADEIFDAEQGLDGPPFTPLLPGRESTFKIGYGVADTSDLVMNVSPGFMYDSVIFTVQ